MKLCLNLRAKFGRSCKKAVVLQQSCTNEQNAGISRNSPKSCQGRLAMFLAAESLNDLNAMDQFFDSEEVFVR